MTVKSLNIYRVNFIVIALMLTFLCVLPIFAQPTSVRDFSSFQRKGMTERRLEELNQISNQIKNNESNIELYKKRIEIYAELLQLNYDNKDWFKFAEEYEKDLSRLVELEQTPESYARRAERLLTLFVYRTIGIYRQPPENLSELYPYNHYVDAVTSDLSKLIKLNAAPENIINTYIKFSTLYSTRPQALVLAPDFPKWKDKIPLKLVQKDFEDSIKYSLLAYKLGANIPSRSEFLKENLVSTYLRNAETAAKLGDQATALKFTQAAQKYRE